MTTLHKPFEDVIDISNLFGTLKQMQNCNLFNQDLPRFIDFYGVHLLKSESSHQLNTWQLNKLIDEFAIY